MKNERMMFEVFMNDSTQGVDSLGAVNDGRVQIKAFAIDLIEMPRASRGNHLALKHFREK